jgi:GT2 family glycosyltransferase
MKKIAFICVNYNNSKITINYIINVFKINNLNSLYFKILIVDNNSFKEDLNILDNYIKNINSSNIELIKNNKNLGYFSGLNSGLNKLNGLDFDFVVIGNNDLSFNFDFIENLLNQTYTNDVMVLAPNIIRKDGIHQNPHFVNKFTKLQNTYRALYYSNYYISIVCQSLYNVIRYFNNTTDRKEHDREIKIFMGYGACYVLTRNFFKHFTNLDSPVFLMGEEGVLTNQILGVCGSILYTPRLVVYHLDHSSIGKLNNKKLYNFSRDSYKVYINKLNKIHEI